jgi:hypothetical protein
MRLFFLAISLAEAKPPLLLNHHDKRVAFHGTTVVIESDALFLSLVESEVHFATRLV